ncbi:hypothetical protein F404_gp116 [Vibrio phage pVp-1]|uniref:Uncharacterized protein n=1 Tax=Vibrio phage pVp-1 TaxID=1150989 RepID=H6WXK7_9CAUD|nr:hypothetical protein F404_gp116 [Vibrio phage pVp-1]AFB83973.1 hypothetical protein pVp-1_0116 [Vibrio phage pVp-1]
MVSGMWPKKYQIEHMLCEVAYSFPKVFHSLLITDDSNKEYTARVCSEKCEPLIVTKKTWEYDKLILEVEQRLLEINDVKGNTY